LISATRGANAVGGPLSTALVLRSGGKPFVQADTEGSAGQAGVCRHFVQGLLIVKK